MVDDGRQIRFRDLGKHLTDGAADVIFTPFLGRWSTMEGLSSRIAFHLLLYPVLSVSGRGLPETALFVVLITKFAASELYNFNREMMPYAVDVV